MPNAMPELSKDPWCKAGTSIAKDRPVKAVVVPCPWIPSCLKTTFEQR